MAGMRGIDVDSIPGVRQAKENAVRIVTDLRRRAEAAERRVAELEAENAALRSRLEQRWQ